MSGLGLGLLVVDSERGEDDLEPESFSHLLRAAEGSGVTPVITVPVRRRDFWNRLAKVCGVVRRWGGGICLVAGNPEYLDGDEVSVRAGGSIVRAAVCVREDGLDCMMLVGTENLVGPAVEAARKARAIPFTLLSERVTAEITRLKSMTGGPVAVYAPFYVGDDTDGALRVLQGYVRRRGYSMARVVEGVEKLAMVGELVRVSSRVGDLRRCGATYVVGFPAQLDFTQITAFANALEC
ncbi:MAG: hypothetical protein QW756_00850 [Nitrososphaerota archaeon]